MPVAAKAVKHVSDHGVGKLDQFIDYYNACSLHRVQCRDIDRSRFNGKLEDLGHRTATSVIKSSRVLSNQTRHKHSTTFVQSPWTATRSPFESQSDVGPFSCSSNINDQVKSQTHGRTVCHRSLCTAAKTRLGSHQFQFLLSQSEKLAHVPRTLRWFPATSSHTGRCPGCSAQPCFRYTAQQVCTAKHTQSRVSVV